MIPKAEALLRVLRAVPEGRTIEETPLVLAQGRVLARDAASDQDIPPFNRSTMDGWAVRAADVAGAGASLKVAGRRVAGDRPEGRLGAGEAVKIMTGAPVPEGADAVVMVEESATSADGAAVAFAKPARAGQNVSPRGEDARRGDVIVRRGTPLDAPALSLLATLGVDPVPTFAPPRVCVIPTGDELVPPDGPPPGPGRIRESNGTLLEAQVRHVSPAIPVVRPGIARDTRESLAEFLDVGLGHDVLILSGGVSMGELDLVGVALAERGLTTLIEKVAIKPGKPLLFGTATGDSGRRCIVFGLPGNPVSSFVTFELFVRPFLLAWLGHDDVSADACRARLDVAAPLRVIPRTQHVPAVLSSTAEGLVARPVSWHGSADLRGLADANGFVIVEPDGPAPGPGDLVQVERIAWKPLRGPARPGRA